MSANVYIPPEVIDLIVGNLSLTKDEVTLQSCSLVSRSFSSAARRLIFSTLVITAYKTMPDKSGDARRLRNVERSSEDTIRRTRDLASLLADKQSDLPLLVRQLQVKIDTRRSIFHSDSHLGKLLSIVKVRASNLNGLLLGSEDHPDLQKRNWSDIPSDIASLLLDLCRTLPISRLRFHCLLDIPVSITTITQCPHLLCIELYGSRFEGHKGGGSDVPQAGVEQTREAENTLSEITNYFPKQGQYLISYKNNFLTTTAIDVNINSLLSNGDLSSLVALLEHVNVSSSLVSFSCTITYRPRNVNFLAGVDLGRLSQLRKASFRTFSLAEDLVTSVSTLTSFLNHGLAKPHQLEEIQLIFKISMLRPKELEDLIYKYNAIDLRLTILHDKYPRLRRFTIRLELILFQYALSPNEAEVDSAQAESLESYHTMQLTNAIQSSASASSFSLPYLQGQVEISVSPRSYLTSRSTWLQSWK